MIDVADRVLPPCCGRAVLLSGSGCSAGSPVSDTGSAAPGAPHLALEEGGRTGEGRGREGGEWRKRRRGWRQRRRGREEGEDNNNEPEGCDLGSH